MRTILLGALAVAVLATPATARELPADILGKWCMTGEDENRSTGMRAEAKEDCGDGSLTIGPRSYKAGNTDALMSECRHGSIRRSRSQLRPAPASGSAA
jgi:hypothetical protein